MATKPKFTFKNYLKELKRYWFVLIAALVIGGGAGAAYSFSKPASFNASSKLSVYNYEVNTGSATSPYAQVGDLLLSEELVGKDFSGYTVTEKPFGVFEIVATASNEEKAIETANGVMESAEKVIEVAFGESAKDYKVTILTRAEKAEATAGMKSRIISTAIIAVGAFALVMIAIFIKFDYTSEK